MEKLSFWSSLFSNFLNFLPPPFFENSAYATNCASHYVQQFVASNFAKNGENFKRGLCLNVITVFLFAILPVVLSLCDVPKMYSVLTEMGGGAQAVVRGEHGPPGPPVATALSVNVFEFLFSEFAACSKSPS